MHGVEYVLVGHNPMSNEKYHLQMQEVVLKVQIINVERLLEDLTLVLIPYDIYEVSWMILRFCEALQAKYRNLLSDEFHKFQMK